MMDWRLYFQRYIQIPGIGGFGINIKSKEDNKRIKGGDLCLKKAG